MRTGRQNQKRGFTLVETVVTVGIVAALAAVVYPTVVKQFDSADPTRAAEDLNNIRTGLETFGVNVRPLQPDDIEDLANPITATAGDDSSARGNQYTATDVANWKGPYLALSVLATTTNDATIVTTGFAATIPNRFSAFDADLTNGGDSTFTLANADFVAVRVKGLSAAAFNAINELIDGPSENSTVLRRHSGRFRCPGNAAPADTACNRGAFYLAVPIR